MTKTVVTSKVGALAAFTKKKMTCLGCKVNHYHAFLYFRTFSCHALFFYTL